MNITIKGPISFKNSIPIVEAQLVLIECSNPSKDGLFMLNDKIYKPTLISLTEKIELNDIYYNQRLGLIGTALVIPKDIDRCVKILALPEHFSSQQLQDIVDGKLKDGNAVLLECELVVFKGGEPDPSGYYIKHDPYITLYKKEEKMVPVSLLEKAFQAGASFSYYRNRPTDSPSPNWDQWFKQNVK